jgi:uncharacterized protein involved in high-affinity Fe2+ transport
VYLQPIEMDPPGMMRPAVDSDVHLESDISALPNNSNGFQEGSFVPYLNVSFTLRKDGSDKALSGDFHAMVANDRPHYGDNLKLSGPGKYQANGSAGAAWVAVRRAGFAGAAGRRWASS